MSKEQTNEICWCGRPLEDCLPPGRRICPSHIDDVNEAPTPSFYQVCPNDGEPLLNTPDGDGMCPKCYYNGRGVLGTTVHSHFCRCIKCRPALEEKVLKMSI